MYKFESVVESVPDEKLAGTLYNIYYNDLHKPRPRFYPLPYNRNVILLVLGPSSGVTYLTSMIGKFDLNVNAIKRIPNFIYHMTFDSSPQEVFILKHNDHVITNHTLNFILEVFPDTKKCVFAFENSEYAFANFNFISMFSNIRNTTMIVSSTNKIFKNSEDYIDMAYSEALFDSLSKQIVLKNPSLANKIDVKLLFSHTEDRRNSYNAIRAFIRTLLS